MKHFEYCPRCGTMLLALGRPYRDTKQEYYYCNNCLVTWLKTNKGLEFKTSLLEPTDKEFESHLPGMIQKDYEIEEE